MRKQFFYETYLAVQKVFIFKLSLYFITDFSAYITFMYKYLLSTLGFHAFPVLIKHKHARM